MKVGVPKETAAGERRVALVPETVVRLRDAGFDILNLDVVVILERPRIAPFIDRISDSVANIPGITS